MIKGRQALADALARLLFEKPLAQLDRSERAELNFLRALDAKASEALVERHPDAARIRSLPTKQVRNRPVDWLIGLRPGGWL